MRLGRGSLYRDYKDAKLDAAEIEKEVAKLMLDDDILKKSGIYPYVLTHDIRHLNIRAFSDAVKRKQYEKQKGICANCEKKFELTQMEADHITPWSEGGKTTEENCQLLCRDCNRRKSNK